MTRNKKTLRSQLTKVMNQAMTVPGHARPEKKEKLNAGAIPRDVWGDLVRPAMLMR